jgi:hypothetical protein
MSRNKRKKKRRERKAFLTVTGKTHSWIEDVLGSMAQSSVSDTLTRFPILGGLWLFFNPGWMAGLIQAATRHQSYTIELTNK